MPFRVNRAMLGLAASLVLATAAWSQPSNLIALHDALHLGADQEPGWNAYAASVATPPGTRQRRRAAAMLFPTLTAPRRIDLVEAEMREDLLELHREAEALKTFYAVLTPAQQKIFDAKTLPAPRDRDDSDR